MKAFRPLESPPLVSVVIPCFNQGRFLDEAVTSVLRQTYPAAEIIVVNDGSDDPETIRILSDYHRPRTRIIHTENRGLAAARNAGIAEADGTYILPLDADDRIDARYIAEAVPVLERRPDIGIVYCRVERFGMITGEWPLPPYSLERMLLDNVVFCSALFRKNDWERTGGYDESLRLGWEDYDFWLSIIEKGRGVYQIPEIRFFYRIRGDSMLRKATRQNKIDTYSRIFKKHQTLFHDHIHLWVEKVLENPDLHRKMQSLEAELYAIRTSLAWRTVEKLRYLLYERILKNSPRLKTRLLRRRSNQ